MRRMYELIPATGQKSFYGKAIVQIESDGTKTLFSYNTPIIKQLPSGQLIRLWSGWSATTGKHIKSFCGLNKAQFVAMSPPKIGPNAPTMTPMQSYKAIMAR